MNIPDPPKPPLSHPADGAEWAENLRPYDRCLDLYSRLLDQNAEYNHQLAETAKNQAHGNELYARYLRRQRQAGLLAIAFVVIVFAFAGLSVFFKNGNG